MKADEFSERLWNAAVRVSKVTDSLPNTRTGRHVAGQLIRCGTSSAPNYDEACGAESRPDFTHKVSIAHKELRETCGWLRFVIKRGLQSERKIAPLLDECDQLRKMLASSCHTAKSGPRPPPQSSILNPQ
jgi:four helix bundle protein